MADYHELAPDELAAHALDAFLMGRHDELPAIADHATALAEAAEISILADRTASLAHALVNLAAQEAA